MAQSFVAAGAWALFAGPAGTATPTMPTFAANDLLVLTVIWKQTTATPVVPSPWVAASPIYSGGTGAAYGAGAGNVSVRHFVTLATAGTTAPGVTLTGGSTNNTGGNVLGAQISSWRATSGYYNIAFWGAGVNTSVTAWTASSALTAGPTAPYLNNDTTILAGDFVEGYAGMSLSTTTQSAHNFAMTGATFGARTVSPTKGASTTGADLGVTRWYAQVATGPGSGNPSASLTQSAATYGVMSGVRIREATAPSLSLGPTGIASAESVTGLSGINLGLVVGDPAVLPAQDQSLYDYLVAQGHTVTLLDDGVALSDTGYHAYLITESGTGSSAAINSVGTCLLPVVLMETSANTAGMTLAAATNPGSIASLDITPTGNTHDITSVLADPWTYAGSSGATYGVADANLSGGCVSLAKHPTDATSNVIFIMESGSTGPLGGAIPNRRVFYGIGVGGTSVSRWNTEAFATLNRSILWAANFTPSGGPTITAGGVGGSAQTLSPTALSSAEAMGSSTLSTRLTSMPTMIASAEALGSPTLAARLTLVPTGLASGESYGVTAATLQLGLSPTGVSTLESHGVTSVANPVPGLILSPTAMASAEQTGLASVTARVTLSPLSMTSLELLGSPTVLTLLGVSPVAVPSAEAVGSPSLLLRLALTPVGLASAEAFGLTAVSTRLSLSPLGVASLEALGAAVVALRLALSPTSIVSQEAFGFPDRLISGQLLPDAIPSVESIGTPSLSLRLGLSPTSITSAQALGLVTLGGRLIIAPSSIASGESLGLPEALLGSLGIAPLSIGTSENFGLPDVVLFAMPLSPASVGSEEAFGVTELTIDLGSIPDIVMTASLLARNKRAVLLDRSKVTQMYPRWKIAELLPDGEVL